MWDYPLLCISSYNPERSTFSPRLRPGVHVHNRPHDISSNKTGGYSGDLKWLVIYIWPLKGYSKIRTAQDVSVSPTFTGKVRHLSLLRMKTEAPKDCSRRTGTLRPLSVKCTPYGARVADGLGLILPTTLS